MVFGIEGSVPEFLDDGGLGNVFEKGGGFVLREPLARVCAGEEGVGNIKQVWVGDLNRFSAGTGEGVLVFGGVVAFVAFFFYDEVSEFVFRENEGGADFFYDGVLKDFVFEEAGAGGESGGDAEAFRGRGHVGVFRFVMDLVVEEVSGVIEEGFEGIGAVFLDEGIGVFAFRHIDDAGDEAGLGEFGEGAAGGFVSGLIGVEAEDGFGVVSFEEGGVLWGEGGAEGGDDVGDTVGVAGNEVDLAFADDDAAFAEDIAFGFVEAVEGFAFGEDEGFGGVDVFGGPGFGIEEATAEGDGIAVFIGDGKHEAIAEPGVGFSGAGVVVVGTAEEAAFDEEVFGVLVIGGPLFEELIGGGGVTELPFARDFGGDATGFEVVAGGGGDFFFIEEVVEPFGGVFMEGEELGASPASFIGEGVEFGLGDDDAGAIGEASDGGGVIDVFVFHDEAGGGATGLAAEAVEGLAGGVDVEGGGFFVVEGAEGSVVGADAFEREVGADELDDIGGGEHFLDGFFGDTGHEWS